VQAHLAGREHVAPADVRDATRALNRQVLDTLTVRLETSGDWSQLAVGEPTWRELQGLESRCRQRERLRDVVGSGFGEQMNMGVRAMFVGPSGTGKSLAARLLAAALGRDLYRLDLSAVVNKYIGETEKNLERAFARAEELDVLLLIDEGDALLTARTAVQSSNDRYANLETNFLLQRLESFEGIVIITTNASQHIDTAFQRRMDVVIPFPPPTALDRWRIWTVHLPESHTVEPLLLEEIARRCELRGGQIRNAVLHASLLALDADSVLNSVHLTAAVRREYRKLNAVCPLSEAQDA
jgi:SpoVK/Ycf46/Vps4 family AAA+-type ATPase